MMMLPVIIEDLIARVSNKKVHPEKRQFEAVTLRKIKEACEKALDAYDKEYSKEYNKTWNKK